MTAKYLKYNDPIHIIWRSGDVSDPYADVVQPNLKIINGRVSLVEIPDEYNHVIIDGYAEVYKDTFGEMKIPASNEFIVDYSNGYVYFNPSEEGKTVSAVYKGRGQIQYPAERIYVHSPNPYAVDNLQQFIELCILKIAEINTAIGNCKKATDEAIEAANRADEATARTNEAIANAEQATLEANQARDGAIKATEDAVQATDDAKAETELMHDDRLRSRIIYQNPVPSFGHLATAYPNPEVGWRAQTLNDGNVYRWDGVKWTFIENVQGVVLRASETMDGLISKEDFIKLRDIEEKAQVNFTGEAAKNALPDYANTRTIVFVIPEEIKSDDAGTIIQFPYDGVITGVSAMCRTAGNGATEILVNRISEEDYINGGAWESVLSSNLFLGFGERVDDKNAVISSTHVKARDFFSISIKSFGIGIKDLTVQINIKI